jgi:hypothetical protein
VVVLAALGLYFGGVLTGVLGYVAIAVAVIFGFTIATGFCPLYTIFGISTCAVKLDK